MRFAYGIVSSAIESVATEIKRYKSGIGIETDSYMWIVSIGIFGILFLHTLLALQCRFSLKQWYF